MRTKKDVWFQGVRADSIGGKAAGTGARTHTHVCARTHPCVTRRAHVRWGEGARG